MARRTLTRDDRRLWSRVERTLDKVKKASAAMPEPETPAAPEPKAPPKFIKPVKSVQPAPQPVATPRPVPHAAPHELEPRRHRRLARERDPIDAKIDLHGNGRFQAQDALTSFLLGAHARGHRAVLVVTGKGSRGGTGIIRASVAEWVAQPPLRAIVAGVSPAHRRHGGDGAVYVTLRKRD